MIVETHRCMSYVNLSMKQEVNAERVDIEQSVVRKLWRKFAILLEMIIKSY